MDSSAGAGLRVFVYDHNSLARQRVLPRKTTRTPQQQARRLPHRRLAGQSELQMGLPSAGMSRSFAGTFRAMHSGACDTVQGVESAATCYVRCAQSDGCVAFTYFPHSSKQLPHCSAGEEGSSSSTCCGLLREGFDAEIVSHPTAVSGWMPPFPPPNATSTLGESEMPPAVLTARWWDMYVRYVEDPSLLRHGPQHDPEWADHMIISRLPTALVAAGAQIVRSPAQADMVVWSLWDFGLCAAVEAEGPAKDSNRIERWEHLKGHTWGSCAAHGRLLKWLTGTARWKRRGGRDFVFTVNDPHQWVQVLEDREARRQGANFWLDATTAVVDRAVLLSAEDCRPAARQGLAIPPIWIPYYINRHSWHMPSISQITHRYRPYLLGFVGSRWVHSHVCPLLNPLLPSSTVRSKFLDGLLNECGPGECLVKVLDESFIDRDNASAVLDLGQAAREAVFCPIPRGDTATTKRFFAAIAAGCVPIVISDHSPLPFEERLRTLYASAVIRIPEAVFMASSFSLVRFVRELKSHPQALREMKRALFKLKDAILFRQPCSRQAHSSRDPGGTRPACACRPVAGCRGFEGRGAPNPSHRCSCLRAGAIEHLADALIRRVRAGTPV